MYLTLSSWKQLHLKFRTGDPPLETHKPATKPLEKRTAAENTTQKIDPLVVPKAWENKAVFSFKTN